MRKFTEIKEMKLTISYKHGRTTCVKVGLSEQQFFAQYLPALEANRWFCLPVVGGKVEIINPGNVGNITISHVDEDV